MDNIILIGMPGAGKSTLGVLLAKATGRGFIDTDVQLQARHGARLQSILDQSGVSVFRELECATICELDCRHTVIATGGSAVYSPVAMQHLRAGATIVHLHLPLLLLAERLADFDQRGVVRAAGQSLASVYEERLPLYQQYAD